jgi:hypothetical protein
MNERIKELLKQAGVGDNWNKADWYSMSPEMIEKFAELIVRECANTIQTEKDTGLYNAQQMTGMTVSRAVIKDHFEIK